MTKVPQDTSAEEPDGGNLQVRLRGGRGSGDRPGLLNSLAESDCERIVQIGSEILSCQEFPALRWATMRYLMELASARAVVSFLGHPCAWRLDNSQRHGCDRRFVRDYVDMYKNADPILRQTKEYWDRNARRRPALFKSSEFMSEDALTANVIYQRLLKPAGLRQAICIALPVNERSFLTFSVLRSESAGDFSRSEINSVWAIVPFIQAGCGLLATTRSRKYLKDILDSVTANGSYDGFAVYNSKFEFIYATSSGKGTLETLRRDIDRHDEQSPTFSPDLREICRRFILYDNSRPLALKTSYIDPSGSLSVTNLLISATRVSGETLLFLYLLSQSNTSAAKCGTADCFTLSQRQRAVANLVAQGLTNVQIATRLAISASTVANHVSSILTRTGMSERSQLMHQPGIISKAEDLPLPNRQRQILIARLCGLSTRATARRLHIHETTVRSHVRAICKKLGVSGMRGVVRYLNEKCTPNGNGGELGLVR